MASSAASSSASSGVSHTDFTPGSIKRIELTNFMTHLRLVLLPSSRVNFIIGVNGSGKSSLVCALCLCLGGTPGDMVRGTTLSTFVMKGKDTAEIEVTLAGRPEDKGDFAVRRSIHCASSKTTTEWHLNGRGCGEAEVKALLRLFHIQMDNPCMFLPQEKVGDFTMLNSQAVLRHTMHAVAMDLEPLFDAIVALQDNVHTGANELDKLMKQAEENEKRLARLQEDKEKFLKYELLGEKVVVLRHRLTYCKMKEAEAEATASRAAVAALEEEGRETVEDLKPLELAKERAEADVAAAGGHKDKTAKALRDAKRAVENWNRKRTETMTHIDEARVEVESLTTSVEERKANLAAAQKRAAALAASIDELESQLPYATLTENMKTARKGLDKAGSTMRELQARKKALEEELTDATEKRKEYNVSTAVATTASSRVDKMRAGRDGGAIASAYDLTTRGSAALRAPVLGPLIAHVEVDPAVAALIETAIPAWLQRAFIVQSRDDAEVDLIKRQTVLQYDPARLATERDTYRHPFSAAEFAELAKLLGPISYGDDLLLDGTPEVVRVMINREAYLHTLIVGTAPDAIERLLKHRNHPLVARISSFMTATVSVRQKRGIDGHINQSRMAIRTSADYLHIREDTGKRLAAEARAAELRANEEQLQVNLQNMTAPMRTAGADVDRARAEMAALTKQLTERRELRARQSTAQGKVDELTASLTGADAKAQAAAALVQLRKYQLRLADVLKDLAPISEAMATAAQADVAAEFEHARAVEISEAALQKYTDRRAKMQSHASRLKAAKVKLVAANEQVAAARAAATEARESISGKKHGIIDPLRAMKFYDSLAENEADVQADLTEAEAEHKLSITDTAAMETYAQTERALRDIRARVKQIQGSHSNNEDKLNRDFTAWHKRMNECVKPIHDVFADRLRMLNVTGLVELECDSNNLKRAGLNVKVSFRKGEAPQRLHKDMQSGGERALTTMMFLMALQRVAQVPFRIVDEINQGVDAANERSLMETVVQITNDAPASASAGRQLFIISPKLLPDLTHAEGMRTHVIVNGSRVTPGPADATGLYRVFQKWLHTGPAITLATVIPSTKGEAGPASASGGAEAGTKRRAAEDEDDVVAVVSKATKKPRKTQIVDDDDDDDF